MAKILKRQFRWKGVVKAIALFVLITIIANALNLLAFVKPAKAVDANDYMLLFWDGNCASPPSGWTVVSDGAGEEFYDATNNGLFPRGNSSYARNAGGALTHSHSVTVADVGLASSVAMRSGSGSTANATAHTHTGSYTSITSVSSLPAYRTLCVIKFNSGIPTGDTAIPNGAIAIFDTDPNGVSGWSNISANFSAPNQFIRGDSAYNNTGGSNTHQSTGHQVSGVTLNGVAGSVANSGTSGNYICEANHTHTSASAVISDTPDTQPQYREIYLGKKSNNGPIPNGMIAMFNDTDSSIGFSVAGWTRLSDSGGPFYERFLKVTGSYGGTGGASQHSHAVISTTSTTWLPSVIDTKTGSGAISTHSHNINTTLVAGTNTNRPPHTDVVIAKKQTNITALTTDKGSYPTLGETITVDSTVNNYHASTNLANTYIDYVIFIDTGTPDGQPTPGETYITNNCAGSAGWASGNYTHQTTGVNVNASASTNDQWQCSNTNFPENTTYTLWARWWDGTSYAYNIYKDKGSVTFTSIPTLSEILFLALIGCVVFLGVRKGVIKLKKDKNNKPKDNSDSYRHQEQNSKTKTQNSKLPKRSIDGIHHQKREK